ncbi:MAG TPA: nucleoside monophosphate kinase [Candidatus Limnocylindrales bacterium]|nr:nucleoside monophosphate kinase [Candidatus Limnocylindrales bacterium]
MKTIKNDRAAWLKASNAVCSNPPLKAPAKAWRLVLLGSPGVGKGTQAELLHQRLGSCHLSTGDVFRAAKSLPDGQRSPAMDQALEFMRRGELVPDKTVLDMISERLRCLHCCGGFLLDGFPRTVAQADALEKLILHEEVVLTAVLNYELPLEEIVARISGRRTCTKCKAVYHVTSRPPRVADVCDNCGGKLFLREDDRPESVRVRMAAYEKSTRPLIHFYQQRGLLVPIVAGGTPEETFQRTMIALEGVLTD